MSILEGRLFNEEALGHEPVRYLHWNVRHTSTSDQIIDHLHKIQDKEGELGIVALLETPIYELEKSDEVANAVAESLDMDYVHSMPRAFHFRHRLKRNAEPVMDGLAILSRYPISDEGRYSIPLGEQKNGLDLYRNRLVVPQLLVAEIRIPGRPEPFKVGTAHLSTVTRHPIDRKREVEIISEHIGGFDLVSLDANAGPNTPYVKNLGQSLRRVDDDKPTYQFEFGPYSRGNWSVNIPAVSRKIDYIFGNPETVSFKEVRAIEDRGPSDHHPMLVLMH